MFTLWVWFRPKARLYRLKQPLPQAGVASGLTRVDACAADVAPSMSSAPTALSAMETLRISLLGSGQGGSLAFLLSAGSFARLLKGAVTLNEHAFVKLVTEDLALSLTRNC